MYTSTRFVRAMGALAAPVALFTATCSNATSSGEASYVYSPPTRSTPLPTSLEAHDITISHARGSTVPSKSNVVLVESPAVRALFTIIRDKNTIHIDFSLAADRLMRILAEEGLALLATPKTIETPCGMYTGLELPPIHTLAAVSIVRAGDTLLEAVRHIAPAVAVGKILIQRDESTIEKKPILFYKKLPQDINNRIVLLVDPMLATGQSAVMAIEELRKAGVPEEHIVFVNVVSCPEGLIYLHSKYPKVRVVTAAIDSGLTSEQYITPGLGDYGDRYFGTDIASLRRVEKPRIQ